MVEIPDDVAREIAETLRGYAPYTRFVDLLDPPPPEPTLVEQMLMEFYGPEVPRPAWKVQAMTRALAVVREAVAGLPRTMPFGTGWDHVRLKDVLALLGGGET